MTPTPLPPELTPAILNELYRQQNATDSIDRQKILLAELEKLGLSHHQKLIEETFAVVLGAPYVFLDGYPGGAVASEQLWAEHDAEIRKWSPWLDEDNFARTVHQSRYYAHHDGLVKSK